MLVVRKMTGLATVQDEGRVGFASHGVPRGGSLVRSLARRANAAVGNVDGAACIEIFGRLALIAERETIVATERGAAQRLRAGEELVVEPDASLRVRYLAIAGGVDAPMHLGSRSTLAVCGLGRALRSGDRILRSSEPGAPREPDAFVAGGVIRILFGPDDPEAAPVLVARPWRIGRASNRTGTRLEGDPIARDAIARDLGPRPSSPMVTGAIQLPAGGEPIVIGPDGPTTGGYPIVAVIARADRDRFHALPLGAVVSFVAA